MTYATQIPSSSSNLVNIHAPATRNTTVRNAVIIVASFPASHAFKIVEQLLLKPIGIQENAIMLIPLCASIKTFVPVFKKIPAN